MKLKCNYTVFNVRGQGIVVNLQFSCTVVAFYHGDVKYLIWPM